MALKVLSILIATMPSRKDSFDLMMATISVQKLKLNERIVDVEIIIDDSMEYNIGTKRQKLLELANGDYIVYIDDDDRISPTYIQQILKATETKPDCIGMSGEITFDGHNKRNWHISKDYGYWHERGSVYYRTPNHISPVRRELALQTGFKPIAFAEDKDYSDRLLPLLKTEVKIDGVLYFYDYKSGKYK